MQTKRLLVVAAVCTLLFLFQLSLAQKSYRISNIETDITVLEAGCVVSVKEKYTVIFSGGAYTRLGIPIRRDSVYTVSSNPTTMVTGLQASLPVSSSMVLAADANDKETAYIILLIFPETTGTATFEFEYNINGYLHSDGNQNKVKYSTLWNDAEIDTITARVHFPESFNLNAGEIVLNPNKYGIKTNNTVEYRMSSIKPQYLFITETRFPLKIDGCRTVINPLAYVLPILGAILFLCICIPICVCLGCISNARRRMFGGGSSGYYTTTTSYSAPGHYNTYGDSYHHHHSSGFGHHHHHHHHGHHHSHSSGGHSSYNKVAGTSGGSGFAA